MEWVTRVTLLCIRGGGRVGDKSYVFMYQGAGGGGSQALHSYVSGVGEEQVKSAVIVAFVGRFVS